MARLLALRRIPPGALLALGLCAQILAPSGTARAQVVSVAPAAETTPVPSSGDAADDSAIWLHPSDPSASRIIGTDKHGGIAVYDLSGAQLQFLPGLDHNNVDLRYGFPLGGEAVDLAASSDRTHDAIAVYRIDPVTGTLTSATAAGGIPVGIVTYGFCLYRSPVTGKLYGFINSDSGQVEQWELVDAGGGLVGGVLVRSFSVGSQTEGCVADDEYAALFIGEENVGIWRYGAEPGDGTARVSVDVTGGGGHLTADVEGLAIYQESDGTGYLLASSQGNSQYAVYHRQAPHAWIGNFQIVASATIDAVTETDGIEVASFAMGPAFPQGLFVAQDGVNSPQNQNYKLVPWEGIAQAFAPALDVDPSFDPRGGTPPPACADGLDNDGDDLVDHPADPGCADADDDDEAADCTPDLDSDGDDRCDAADNCLADPNVDQRDTNADGYGSACDLDVDQSGLVGIHDWNALRTSFGFAAGEPAYDPDLDANGDGVIGAFEFSQMRLRFGFPPGPSGLACAGTVPCP
jgi:3-phytase